MDARLKVLLGMFLVGALVLIGYLGWSFWQGSPRWQLGDPSSWPRYENRADNVSFRYPPHMEVIEPTDPYSNPVSLVLPGERGETVLMQFGTWRTEPPHTNLMAAVERFSRARSSSTRMLDWERLVVDGHEGMVGTMDETSGRRVLEALFWDPAATKVADDPSQTPTAEVREMSLQLAKQVTPAQRALYEAAFREILASVEFLVDEPAADRPEGIPGAWTRYENADAGFSLWLPPEWSAAAGDCPPLGDCPPGSTVVSLRPRQRECPPAGDCPSSASAEASAITEYTVHALPASLRTDVDGLEKTYVDPFRLTAIEGTVFSERVTFPGVGEGISVEGRVPSGDGDRLEHRFAFIAAAGTPRAGRAYVISVRFAEDTSQATRLTQTRAMTRSFRLIPQP